jgi:hypothetical protein
MLVDFLRYFVISHAKMEPEAKSWNGIPDMDQMDPKIPCLEQHSQAP